MLPQTLVLDHVSPATRLLEKRRQMFEVQEALEAQKQDFNKKEQVFKKREEALKLKDLELQESLIRFSKFLQENDSKRARAEKKAADEIKARLQKEKELEQLVEVLEGLKAEKGRIHVVLEKNMRCALHNGPAACCSSACINAVPVCIRSIRIAGYFKTTTNMQHATVRETPWPASSPLIGMLPALLTAFRVHEPTQHASRQHFPYLSAHPHLPL